LVACATINLFKTLAYMQITPKMDRNGTCIGRCSNRMSFKRATNNSYATFACMTWRGVRSDPSTEKADGQTGKQDRVRRGYGQRT
jgi:hypothetical protein